MIPRRIFNATNELKAPPNWDAERNGPCVSLWIRVVGTGPTVQCQSAWEPTPEELALLNAGGSVILTVAGGQLPVRLQVELVSTHGETTRAREDEGTSKPRQIRDRITWGLTRPRL